MAPAPIKAIIIIANNSVESDGEAGNTGVSGGKILVGGEEGGVPLEEVISPLLEGGIGTDGGIGGGFTGARTNVVKAS